MTPSRGPAAAGRLVLDPLPIDAVVSAVHANGPLERLENAHELRETEQAFGQRAVRHTWASKHRGGTRRVAAQVGWEQVRSHVERERCHAAAMGAGCLGSCGEKGAAGRPAQGMPRSRGPPGGRATIGLTSMLAKWPVSIEPPFSVPGSPPDAAAADIAAA